MFLIALAAIAITAAGSLIAVFALNIHTGAPWFLIMGILFAGATLYIAAAKEHCEK